MVRVLARLLISLTLFCAAIAACTPGKATPTLGNIPGLIITTTATPSTIRSSVNPIPGTATAELMGYPPFPINPPTPPSYPPPATATSAPTPVIGWHVGVTPAFVNFSMGGLLYPGWYSTKTSTEVPARPQLHLSANCGDSVQIFQVNELQTPVGPSLKEAPIALPCMSQVWNPDQSAVALITQENVVYLWSMDEPDPVYIGPLQNYTQVAWSPDSSRLIMAKDTGDYTATVIIVDKNGKTLQNFDATSLGSDNWDWITDRIVVHDDVDGQKFYDAPSGRLLVNFHDRPAGDGIFHQSPGLSPDRHWMTLDLTSRLATQSASSPFLMSYHLYDLQNEVDYPLLESSDVYLDFTGWSADSSDLYVISRPADPAKTNSVGLLYGLLAYHPGSRTFNLLFKDALFYSWNYDHKLAFLVYHASSGAGKTELDGGIFDFTTGRLAQSQFISDQEINFDDPIMIKPDGFPQISWSPDSTRLVFTDSRKELVLLSSNGATIKLADSMPSPDPSWYEWSADGRRLFVENGGQWILDVPAP